MKRTHRNEKRAPKASASPSASGLLIISLFPYCPVKFSVSSPRTGRSNSPAKASEGGRELRGLLCRRPPFGPDFHQQRADAHVHACGGPSSPQLTTAASRRSSAPVVLPLVMKVRSTRRPWEKILRGDDGGVRWASYDGTPHRWTAVETSSSSSAQRQRRRR
jgi:hypothetical protein